MARAYLLLGGNIDNRATYLQLAREKISLLIGHVSAASSIFESRPWGFADERQFLNQLVITETMLEPVRLMNCILDIENHLGRQRCENHYTARTMDIDILFYDNMIISEKDLVIPHPLLHLRRFALEPLAETDPALVHPLLDKPVSTLLKECPDRQKVTRLDSGFYRSPGRTNLYTS